MSGENQIEIDEGALARELASVEVPTDPAADGEPAQLPGPPALTQEQELAQIQARAPFWKGGADFLVNFLCDTVAPAWGVPAERREKLAREGAIALAAWFPDDAIPVKYLVLLNVVSAGWEIVTEQRDRHGGKIPPLRLPAPARTGGGGGSATSA